MVPALPLDTNTRISRLSNLTAAFEQHEDRTAAFDALDRRDRIRILHACNMLKFNSQKFDDNKRKDLLLKEIQIISTELQRFELGPVKKPMMVARRFSIVSDQPYIPELTPKAKSEEPSDADKEPEVVGEGSEVAEPLPEAESEGQQAAVTKSKAKVKVYRAAMLQPQAISEEQQAAAKTSKASAKPQNASQIVKAHKLESFFKTYLDLDFKTLKQAHKDEALKTLLKFVVELSKIESLPTPASYDSLRPFFQLVEARNLIRMAGRMHLGFPHLDIEKTVGKLEIHEEPKETLKLATTLQKWFTKNAEKLAQIKELNFNSCNLALVPKEIQYFKALEIIILDRNNLHILSKELSGLISLRAIYASSNRLLTLRRDIGQLTNMTDFHLANNELSSIPKDIEKLQALRTFSLQNNRLSFLPGGLGRIQSLASLNCAGNGLINLPHALATGKRRNNHKPRFPDLLDDQNKELQLKTFLDLFVYYLRSNRSSPEYNLERVRGFQYPADFTRFFWETFGEELYSQLKQCFLEVYQEAAKTDPKVAEVMKKPDFAQFSIVIPEIDPALKLAAIAKFRESVVKKPEEGKEGKAVEGKKQES